MKKFGFGKKSEGDDDDRNRAGLFGRKKPAASKEENPYAQQPAEDPYARMTPYQQARANLATGQQAPRPGAAGLPSGPRPGAGGLPSGPGPYQRTDYATPPPSYQGSPQVGGGYAPEKFGASGGYGSNRYDSGTSTYGGAGATSGLPSQRLPARGPGGYGGLGPADEDVARDELLGGARVRQVAPPAYVSTADREASDAATGSYGGGYGEQRELTEEEMQRQEYGDIKNQIDDTMTKTDQSLDRTLAMLDQATETGTSTLARLAGQREMLHNTQKNLDLAANQHRVATDKTKELETLNRSMFAVHVANPFTSKRRLAEKDQQVLERHRMERANREAIREQQYSATQNMEKTFSELSRPTGAGVLAQGNAAVARSKFAFGEDDSDEEWTNEQARKEVSISNKLDLASKGMQKLHMLAVRQGDEVVQQNGLIDILHKDVSHPFALPNCSTKPC
jgi:hypothetical protein